MGNSHAEPGAGSSRSFREVERIVGRGGPTVDALSKAKAVAQIMRRPSARWSGATGLAAVGASAQIVAHVSAENRIYIFGEVFGRRFAHRGGEGS